MSDLLDVPERLWVRISDLAKEKGITRQSMSERVKKFEKAGHLNTRKEGRFVLVNIAEFDLAVEQNGNGFAEQRANTSSASDESSFPELRKSQARKAEYDAEMARLKLEREQRKILPIEEVEKAAIEAATAILNELEKLPNYAEEIHKNAKDKNLISTRKVLKDITRNVRSELAAALTKIMQTQELKDKINGKS